MLAFAIRTRDRREALGQLPRLIFAAPGSWIGRAPQGNTGGADVGIFTPMEIPADPTPPRLGRPRRLGSGRRPSGAAARHRH
jgi:hypothetical protein